MDKTFAEIVREVAERAALQALIDQLNTEFNKGITLEQLVALVNDNPVTMQPILQKPLKDYLNRPEKHTTRSEDDSEAQRTKRTYTKRTPTSGTEPFEVKEPTKF